MISDKPTGPQPFGSGYFAWLLLVGVGLLSPARAATIELQLVPYNNPDTVVTEKSRPLSNPVSTPQGMVMKQVGVETVAWATNILVDNKPRFERYLESEGTAERKYLGRAPKVEIDLAPGKHVIWPGNQEFTVANDGSITSTSPELKISGNVVKILCYPLTVRAFRANPEEGNLPMSMRVSALPNMTIREAGDAETSKQPLDLVPRDSTNKDFSVNFSPLTLWLPANTVGKGYLVHPVGLTLHLTPNGVIPGAGGGATVQDLRVEKNLVDIPLYGYPVQGEIESGNRLVVPGVEQFVWTRGHGAEQLTNWYPRAAPYVLQLSEIGPTLLVDGDLRKLEFKRMAIDYSDKVINAQRLVLAEEESQHLTPGKPLRVRIRALDSRVAIAAEVALKELPAQLAKARQEALEPAKKKAGAEAAIKANAAQIEARTKELQAPKLSDDKKKEIQSALASLNARTADLRAALAAATADADPLAANVNQLASKIEALKLSALSNPLASAAVFAQIRAYDGGDWKDLAISPRGEDREFDLAIPAVPDGIYRLKIGVKGDDNAHRPLATESWVTIAAERPYSVGLFTNRGRDAFYRGEGFWIGLGIVAVKEKIPAGTPIAVDLIDASNKRLPIYRQQAGGSIDQRQTSIIRIDPQMCLSIAAGHYRIEAKVGEILSRSLNIDIVDPEPRTHFTNLLNLKYNSMDKDYDRIIETGQGAEEFAQQIANLHYNAVLGLYYGLDRVVQHDAQIEQLARERTELGPWESYYQPASRDKFMSALLRRNIRFYEDIFTYNDTGLPRDPRFLDASARYIALETASMRFSPAFKGVSLYDEFYNSGDNGNIATAQLNYAAQELAYREQYADKGYTSARALKALDRFAGRPFGQRDYHDIEMFRTWPEHEDKDWRVFSERMSGSSKRVMPDAFNFTLTRYWGPPGGDLAVCGNPDDVFSGLDAAACVVYKDGGTGDWPVFSAMQANIMRVRDDLPVWTHLHDAGANGIYGMHLVRQAFFGLSQKVEGITYFDIAHDPHNPSPTDHFQTLKNLIGGITEPYGDFLMSLDKGYEQVAIYYSRQAEYLSARKPNSIPKACEGLWVACMRAGYPARFLTDDQLLDHRGDRYKVIFVPGIVYEDETDPRILKELKRLIDAGKTIIVEKSSKLPLERIVRADSEFDEYDDKLGGAFPRYEDYETNTVLERTEETTKVVRSLLSQKHEDGTPKYVEAATETDMLFSPDWLKKGDGQYMVMCNYAPTKFTGLYRTLYQAPDMPVIRFPKRPAAAVYDVLEMTKVAVQTDGDSMTLQADLRDYPGKIYAFLPAEISRVSLQCTPKVAGGKNIDYVVSVVDAKGKAINASFPIEITLTSPSGNSVFHVYRSAAPTYSTAYRAPVNAEAGNWKLKVRELISGAVGEATISVEPGEGIRSADDSRQVWVRDAGKVKAFIADKTPGVIVVNTLEDWVVPQARRLAAALTAAGKPTTVEKLEDVVRLPPDWDRINPTVDGSRLWRGDLVQPGLFVDKPVILLGKRMENRLIEGIVRRGALVESISSDFPGAGRAIVAWAPLAFSTKFDSILVLAEDPGALANGVDELLASAPVAEIPIRQIVPAVHDPAASMTDGIAAARSTTSLRHQIGMLDAVNTIDVDPATGRTLVGTFGYGDNLFCFDAHCKLLWKMFLPEQNVYFARWYDGGKRILAATGRGPWIFMLKPPDGTGEPAVVRKFAASEWPDGHGYDGFWEGQTDTQVQIEINKKLNQIIIGGRTGLLAVDYDGKKMWFRDRAEAISAYPGTAEQNNAACFSKSVELGNFALSPDGKQIAHGESLIVGSTPGKVPGSVVDLWAYRPMILDARDGKVIAHNEDDPGSRRGWSIEWPLHSADPIVRFESVTLALDTKNGKLSKPIMPPEGRPLLNGNFLNLGVSSAALLDSKGNIVWSTSDEHIFPDALTALDADEKLLFRCDIDGLLRCTDVASGKTLWEYKLAYDGYPAALADGGVVVGTTGGGVVRLDKSGKQTWIAALIDLHERPGTDYGAYIQAALRRDVDNTGEFYPTRQDHPGDYDNIFRMGVEQLIDGAFQSNDPAASTLCGVAALSAGARSIPHPGTGSGGNASGSPGVKNADEAMMLPTGQLVTQKLQQRIVPRGTYLLEFWYRVPDDATRLVAGAMLAGEHDSQILTASKFGGRAGEWTFGRLAVKTLADTKTIDVGFQADGGIVQVKNPSFRAIRFPSANLLANAELQAIEPTFVRDLRVQYDRIPPEVRDRLMGKSRVAAYRQGPGNTATLFTQEEAFLHNGRIDDVGSFWAQPPDPIGFSAVLAKASWISHIVLYLNNATPDNTYRFISILANNFDTHVPEQVALVRGNDRRFVVINFEKPIYTDSIKILSGFHGGHKECLTEVEIYGPLGGPNNSSGGFPKDDEGYPMFMGNPAHVPTTRPADINGTYSRVGAQNCVTAYNCGPTVADDLFTWGDAPGDVASMDLAAPASRKKSRQPSGMIWPLQTVTPTSTPARYAGCLLVGSADYQLHAVADNGVYLWGYKTGGRIFSSPLPDGDDVYFGSDDHSLYKVDLHSGMLLWEFHTGDRVRSSPALANGKVYAASWDGFLYAVGAESGQLVWKAALAKFTRASPAVAASRVYIGDESGQMLCFDAESGKLLWSQPLGGFISTCPLVTEDGEIFVSEDGNAAMVNKQGSVLWRRNLDVRVKGQAFATKTQALIPTNEGLIVLKCSDGTTDRDVNGIAPGQVYGVVAYQGKVCLVRAAIATEFNIPPRTYALYSGTAEVWGKVIKP